MTNVNDESPEFPNDMQSGLRYDAAVGSDVYLAKATDADESLITQFEYLLKVIAVDDGSCCGGITTRTSTGTLTVNILTDNENRPLFPDCQSLTPHVKEEQADYSIKAALMGQKPMQIGCTLITCMSLVTLKVTAGDPDFGTNGEQLLLKVIGRDQGNPALYSSASVVINLITYADNQPPKWLGNESNFQVSVPENHDKAKALVNSTANSSSAMPTLSFGVTDSFDNLFYTFALSSNGRIQAGSLRHLYDFDHEKITQYTVRLRATDVENEQAIRICTVAITDVNDNEPRFLGINPDNSLLELRIQEGDYTKAFENGELVDTINAVDDDGTAPNNQVQEYRITSDGSGFFQIDATSGKLTTKANIDKEHTELYMIQVEAVDAAPSSFLPNGKHNTGGGR
ncbi:neural-cadherin-like [Mya arenaria]|uniref:neural-cadherin-like n=1 Tax=Mya arenaria TaxID=6604 RepID=UPI0022E3F4A9|nr:neural-cadherin-like [Mya arenaria]